uniref:Uncharacterized protein n=1 Tax=Phaeodactylum tricornutum TaxID=2850 RepID=A0A8J9SVV0_PHATR
MSTSSAQLITTPAVHLLPPPTDPEIIHTLRMLASPGSDNNNDDDDETSLASPTVEEWAPSSVVRIVAQETDTRVRHRKGAVTRATARSSLVTVTPTERSDTNLPTTPARVDPTKEASERAWASTEPQRMTTVPDDDSTLERSQGPRVRQAPTLTTTVTRASVSQRTKQDGRRSSTNGSFRPKVSVSRRRYSLPHKNRAPVDRRSSLDHNHRLDRTNSPLRPQNIFQTTGVSRRPNDYDRLLQMEISLRDAVPVRHQAPFQKGWSVEHGVRSPTVHRSTREQHHHKSWREDSPRNAQPKLVGGDTGTPVVPRGENAETFFSIPILAQSNDRPSNTHLPSPILGDIPQLVHQPSKTDGSHRNLPPSESSLGTVLRAKDTGSPTEEDVSTATTDVTLSTTSSSRAKESAPVETEPAPLAARAHSLLSQIKQRTVANKHRVSHIREHRRRTEVFEAELNRNKTKNGIESGDDAKPITAVVYAQRLFQTEGRLYRSQSEGLILKEAVLNLSSLLREKDDRLSRLEFHRAVRDEQIKASGMVHAAVCITELEQKLAECNLKISTLTATIDQQTAQNELYEARSKMAQHLNVDPECLSSIQKFLTKQDSDKSNDTLDETLSHASTPPPVARGASAAAESSTGSVTSSELTISPLRSDNV